MSIAANMSWQDTGVVVEPGDRLKVTASGTWSMGPICGTADADGVGHASSVCSGMEPVPGRVTSTLIGKIGPTGVPFAVGKLRSMTADSSGTLLLGPNASGMFFDNTGALSVRIERLPSGRADRAGPTKRNVAAEARSSPGPVAALKIELPRGTQRVDDIAVIVGNGIYAKAGKDIPDVDPAHADAAAVKEYARTTLGIREGNIIDLRDATAAKLTEVFGSESDHRGQLHDWVRPGKSRVFVYYAGHGAPASESGGALLVPVDANAARIELSGYPLERLYRNLSKVPAQSVTVVLEACFSGASQSGSILPKASPIYRAPKTPPVPANLTVIAAGAANQIASWEEDSSHGLFTKYFLKAMAGEADTDRNGTVDHAELQRYLDDTLTYFARRYYGRDQRAQIVVGAGR